MFMLKNEEFKQYMFYFEKLKRFIRLDTEAKDILKLTKYIIYSSDKNYNLSELFQIYYGILIRDIGYTQIPSSILNKNQKLNDEEMKIVQTHPTVGYEMIKDDIKSEIILNIVLLHHKRIDMSGYGPNVESIPDYIQIITVADMYNSMTHGRPYRDKPLTHKEAMNLMAMESKNGKINQDYVDILKDYNLNKETFDFLSMII